MLATGVAPVAVSAPDVISVEMTGVKSLGSLVEAIEAAAGPRMPARVNVRDIYRAFASAFVEYGHAAIAQGVKIPKRIADKMSGLRRVVIPVMVLIPLWGMYFAVPLAIYFEIILGSLAIVGLFITAEISSRAKKRLKPASV